MRFVIFILILCSKLAIGGGVAESLPWFLAADFAGIRLSNAKLPMGYDSLLAQMNQLLPVQGGTDEVSVAESYSYSINKMNKDTIQVVLICKNFVESIFSDNWVPIEKKVIKLLATSEGFCKDFAPIVSPQALYRHYKINVTEEYTKAFKSIEIKLKKRYRIKD
jgi:hypothetical protein